MNSPGFAGIGKTDAATAFFQEGMDRAIFLDLLHVVRKQAGGKIEDFTGALRFDGWVGDRVANVDVGYSFADQGQVPCPVSFDGMADGFPAGSRRYQDEFVFIVIMEGILKPGKFHERKGPVDIVNDFPPQDFHGSGVPIGFGSMVQ